MNEVDKAELIQGLKAFLIPTSLFIACLLGAAGTFLIREGYGVGWGFIAASLTILVAAFAAFINFQNKLRSAGKMVDPHDEMIPDFEEEALPESAEDHRSLEVADSEIEVARQKAQVQ